MKDSVECCFNPVVWLRIFSLKLILYLAFCLCIQFIVGWVVLLSYFSFMTLLSVSFKNASMTKKVYQNIATNN